MSKNEQYNEDFSNALGFTKKDGFQDPFNKEAAGMNGHGRTFGYSEEYWKSMCHDGPSYCHEFDQRDPDRVRQVFPSDDKGSPAFLVFIIIGSLMGCLSVIVAMAMGLRFLPILAVYCSVGSSVTLGSAVVFALLKTDSCGSE